MKPLLLIVTFLLTISASFAQKGRIEGKITDSKTGAAVAGVTVLIKETAKGIATNLEYGGFCNFIGGDQKKPRQKHR